MKYFILLCLILFSCSSKDSQTTATKENENNEITLGTKYSNIYDFVDGENQEDPEFIVSKKLADFLNLKDSLLFVGENTIDENISINILVNKSKESKIYFLINTTEFKESLIYTIADTLSIPSNIEYTFECYGNLPKNKYKGILSLGNYKKHKAVGKSFEIHTIYGITNQGKFEKQALPTTILMFCNPPFNGESDSFPWYIKGYQNDSWLNDFNKLNNCAVDKFKTSFEYQFSKLGKNCYLYLDVNTDDFNFINFRYETDEESDTYACTCGMKCKDNKIYLFDKQNNQLLAIIKKTGEDYHIASYFIDANQDWENQYYLLNSSVYEGPMKDVF